MAQQSLFVALVVCSMLAVASAEKSYLARYPLGGGVDKYKKLADEICQIQDAASGNNIDQVKKIYIKNKADAGYSDSLQAFATKDFSGQRYFQLAAKYYKGAGWLNSFFMEAVDGTGDFQGATADQRQEGIIKTTQSAMGVQMMLKEIDSAATELASGNKDGAVKAMDESWAVFASRPTCGPYYLADKYANQFGTINDCQYNTSMANKKIVDGYISARAAAKSGDKSTFDSSTASIVQGILESHIQAVLNYAKKMSGNTDKTKAKEQQTEGYVFYRTIAPFVAEVSAKADADILKYIETEAPAATSYQFIKSALESTYTGLKVDTSNIGAWKDSPSVTCPKTSGAAAVAAKAFALFAGLVAALVAALL